MMSPGCLNPPYAVSVFQEELGFIAARAALSPDCETGGSFFGLRKSGGDLVILLATPPGQGAVATRAHFEQDVEEVKGWARELDRHYGLEYVGDQHNHHKFALSHPSLEDATNMASISGKLGVPGLTQWILNLIREDVEQHRPEMSDRGVRASERVLASWRNCWDASRRAAVQASPSFLVQVSPFVYPEIASPHFEPCSIKILPGRNPVRRDLERIDPDDSLGLSFDVPPLPLDQVVITSNQATPLLDRRGPRALSVPQELIEDCRHLPPSVLAQIRCGHVQEGLVVEIPLPDDAALRLVYDMTPSYLPSAAFYRPNKSVPFMDVGSRILGEHDCSSISVCYAAALSLRHERVCAMVSLVPSLTEPDENKIKVEKNEEKGSPEVYE